MDRRRKGRRRVKRGQCRGLEGIKEKKRDREGLEKRKDESVVYRAEKARKGKRRPLGNPA